MGGDEGHIEQRLPGRLDQQTICDDIGQAVALA
jgi:hypothetical protein